MLDELEVTDDGSFIPRYNIAPTQRAAVVAPGSLGKAELRQMRWGYIPFWAKDESIGSSLINARSETAGTKPAFRHAARRQRCLVLADGFYEWQRIGARKQPVHIRMKDREPFAMAGLWDRWVNDGGEIQTFTILTCEPNELLRSVHNRMPVILNMDCCRKWLGDASFEEQVKLCAPFQAEKMEWVPVSTIVNTPREDSPRCLEEVKISEPVQSTLF